MIQFQRVKTSENERKGDLKKYSTTRRVKPLHSDLDERTELNKPIFLASTYLEMTAHYVLPIGLISFILIYFSVYAAI